MSETDYASLERYLISKGWSRRVNGTFSDGLVELVFDTSHYLEVYKSDGTRVAEGRINSITDLEAFLAENRLSN